MSQKSHIFDHSVLIDPKGATTIWYGQKNLNIFGKLHYLKIVLKAKKQINQFYNKAIKEKECYYGPFKGEFGHFLLHNLPFLSNLHKQGVKIHYCGMELHRGFLVDTNGNSIIHRYYPLRDFFAEVSSSSNDTIPPIDVQKEIEAFYAVAKKSGKAFLDIADHNMYWFVFRNWQLVNNRQHVYNINQVYKTANENSCVIFPRKKGNTVTPNNGGPWDYIEIAKLVAPYFDKVYITGHPSMSAEIESEGKIEVCLSTDNKVVIEKCCNAKLIITQHSGAIHIGCYTNTDVLLIFNGEPPIKGLIDTLRFRKNLTQQPLQYAFNKEQIVGHIKTLSLNK
ncbi:MAG: hypothetical protein H0U95_06250 [Bacteroidetes bacterium]|nr:hypothetical protein [Bacteroidota bacterium]